MRFRSGLLRVSRRAKLLRFFLTAWLLAAVPVGVGFALSPQVAEAATPEEEEALQAVTAQTLQKAKGLLAEQKYVEAHALVQALSQALHSKLGANHQLTVSTDQLLGLVTKLKQASASAQPTERDPNKTYVKKESYASAVDAQEEAKAGLALLQQKKYVEGLQKVDHAMDTLEFTLGPDHEFVITCRKLLLEFYTNVYKEPAKAQAVRDREQKARSQYKEPEDTKQSDEGRMLIMKAMTAFAAQDFEASLRLFEQALPKVDSILQGNLETKVSALTILSRLYAYTLKYDKAEALVQQLIGEVEEERGKNALLLEVPLEAAVQLKTSSSGPSGALPYANRRVKILASHSKGSDKHLDALVSRGDAFLFTGKTDLALKDYFEAQKLLGSPNSNPVLMVQLSLSIRHAFAISGREKDAADVDQSICQFGKGTANALAKSLSSRSCTRTELASGNWEQAEKLLRDRLRFVEARDGSLRTLEQADLVHQLALVTHLRGDQGEALRLMRRSVDMEEERMRTELLTGSDAQKRAKFGKYQSTLYDVLDLGGGRGGKGPAVDLAFETLLRRKGRLLDAEADAVRAARLMTNPEEKKLFERQQQVRSLMTGLALKGQQSPTGPGEFSAALAKLEAEDEQLTRQLNEKSQAYRTLNVPVTIAAVQGKLPQGTALIEYSLYARHDLKTGQAKDLRVALFVLNPSGSVQGYDLGDAAPILKQMNAFRKAMTAKAPVESAAQNLYQLLLAEARSHLPPSTKRLLIAPDDALNLVPFGALQSKANRYLIQDYEVVYLSSGRDLLRLDSLRNPQTPPLVVGNPDFGARESGSRGKRSGDLAGVNFPALPGTAEEIKQIAGILDDARLLSGSEATKRAVQAVKAPSVLHVATHGFFLKIDDRAVEGTRGFDITSETPTVARAPSAQTENPLIRSGLAFSAANDPSSAAGILSALEAATLDLDGTQLVVLSACETAVGSTDPGEGVYGLRRALFVAGSESQLMSLWKVDDAATRDLMIDVYRGLKKGTARGEAVRAAQLKMLKTKDRAHPYYWAAFIPSGNFGPMSFQVDAPAAVAAQTQPSSSSKSRASSSFNTSHWAWTAGGSKSLLGVRGTHLGNLLFQDDRLALTGVLTIEVGVISGDDPEVETGLAFHDALSLELEFGARMSEAHLFADGDKESGLAAGYFAGYEFALGYRAPAVGLLAGVRPAIKGFAVGSATHAGIMLPLMGLLELRGGNTLVALRGWYGPEVIVDQGVMGGSLDVVFGEELILRVTGEQTKLVTKVGGTSSDDRLEAGRQVGSSVGLSVGAYLD